MENREMTIGKKLAAGLVLASASALTFAEGSTVTVDASEITALGGPIAVAGGAILTILIAIKGWKLIRRAL